MKSFIISMPAEVAVTAKQWLVPGTSVGVKPAAGAVAPVGIATSFADPAKPPFKTGNVGVIKQGLIKVAAVAGTYAIGDAVELHTTGQQVTALTTNPKVATVCEDKVLSATGELLVYVNLA